MELFFRSIITRHPLARLLSAYLLIFRESDAHVKLGISANIKKLWLNQRQDPLTPEPNEIDVDIKSRPTLTFRQFVHFILDCPKEIPNCSVSFGHF